MPAEYLTYKFVLQVETKTYCLNNKKRIRSKHTTPTAIRNFKHLLKHNPVFISQELFCLYGIDYCNSISKLLNFPIDIKKIKALLKYNANKPYITNIKKGLFDKDAHRTSYIES